MVSLWDSLLRATTLEAVFLAALVEKFIPVLPSYVLYPAIGIGAEDGWDLALRCAVGVAGSLGGALGWYGLGAWLGEGRTQALVARHGRWLFLSTALYTRLAEGYRRHPAGATILGQFVPTVRIFQALPAGVLRLPLPGFLAATALGSAGWIFLLAGAGHLLHRQGWAAAEAGLAVLAGLVALELGAVLVLRLLRRPAAAAAV